jgi:hypothetical protein
VAKFMAPEAAGRIDPQQIDTARDRIREAIALQEMAIRMDDDNVEDFEMLQRACHVTFRLLEEANESLRGVSP